jgi:hypothetical protein
MPANAVRHPAHRALLTALSLRSLGPLLAAPTTPGDRHEVLLTRCSAGIAKHVLRILQSVRSGAWQCSCWAVPWECHARSGRPEVRFQQAQVWPADLKVPAPQPVTLYHRVITAESFRHLLVDGASPQAPAASTRQAGRRGQRPWDAVPAGHAFSRHAMATHTHARTHVATHPATSRTGARWILQYTPCRGGIPFSPAHAQAVRKQPARAWEKTLISINTPRPPQPRERAGKCPCCKQQHTTHDNAFPSRQHSMI